jgi:hypothetical protein
MKEVIPIRLPPWPALQGKGDGVEAQLPEKVSTVTADPTA